MHIFAIIRKLEWVLVFMLLLNSHNHLILYTAVPVTERPESRAGTRSPVLPEFSE